MSASFAPEDCCVGLVGYGEVGRIIAEDLRARGVVRVAACDIKLGTDNEAPLREHAQQYGVAVTPSHAELASRADLVLSAVTASQTVAVAEAIAPAIRRDTWFLDFNSASPGAKKRAAALIDGNGGRFVEAAVMTSIPPYRIRVPILLGGSHAEAIKPLLDGLGFAAKVASAQLGVASATKMCRSVMIKGLEAMVVESYCAARAYGVEKFLLASLAETFPGVDWEKQGTYFFERAIKHGRRRAEEMVEAAATVSDMGLEPWSAAGTAKRQAFMADLADSGAFGDPKAPRENWRLDADRLLAAITRKT